METRLTTAQVAELCNKHESTIRRWAESGKLQGDTVLNEFNSPMYVFSLEAIERVVPNAVQKYFYQVQASFPTPSTGVLPERRASKPLDCYSPKERAEIAFWLRTVEEWQLYRSKYPGSKAEADDKFCALCAKTNPERPFSVKTLYRRWRSIQDNDLDGLIEKRGKERKGKSDMPEMVWEAFKCLYLDQAQHPMRKCYEYTIMWMRQDFPDLVPDIPSYCTFTRRVKTEIPLPVKVLG